MTFEDIIKITATVMASLGGGGAIVFGLSTFLGKLWADRTLENQRQEYAQLNMQMQHSLEALGLFHSLRTKEEFERLAKLWKSFANLSFAFHAMYPGDLSSTC